MKVNIVGLGYIGLPTALMLAANGIQVIGSDINNDKISKLKRKQFESEEKGMETIFNSAINNGIIFSEEVIKADCYIISVPTPYNKKNKKINPKYVTNAVEDIISKCPKGALIIIESTVSPGTIDMYIRPIFLASGLIVGRDVHIVHAPERIIPGNMIDELTTNSRVIGVDDVHIGERVKTLYSSFCKGEIVITDIRAAEMSKVVENTFRDINIAFANELTKICRAGDMDVYEIIRIANMHPRVNILQPGPGVGGHCISVDPWFLVGDYPGLSNIILAARKINDSMPEFVLERISEIMRENSIEDLSRVGIYGLTYKEDVDDIRESPTLQMLDIMERHLAKGVKLYDPFVKDHIFKNQYHDFDQFVNAIDLIVIMVGHTHIKREMDKLVDKIILDTRNVCGGIKAYKL